MIEVSYSMMSRTSDNTIFALRSFALSTAGDFGREVESTGRTQHSSSVANTKTLAETAQMLV
ncbi:hypothetical protein SAMN04488542_13839 [Fontibacillus panacisegetis]|uniref:Uncharacterized protein n=1 Tax=Fontibacillus panacisegetis TaxID=670482 RepID=A0A1G7TQU8_9BACL|nr:hypothetical protein SAMN04488542_13839 [Fontibacillus panacisegetis]